MPHTTALSILNKAQKMRAQGSREPIFIFIAESFEEVQTAVMNLDSHVHVFEEQIAILGADVDQLRDQVNQAALALQPGLWQAPAYQNGWADNGAGLPPLQYRILQLGRLEIAGVCKGGTLGAVVFNLPVGFRPAIESTFAVGSGSETAGVSAYLRVAVNGDVTIPGIGAVGFAVLVGGVISLF